LCQLRALLYPSVIDAKQSDSDGGLHARKTSNTFSIVTHVCCITQLAKQHSKAAQHAPGEPRH